MNWTLGIWTMAPERSRGGCPAPFPQELPRRCIRLLSFKDDLVLDPFNGSGTTTFVAKQEGRHFIGIDISGSYCQDAREWIETGVKPARPAMKRIDKHKKLKADVLTKRCGCGEIIDIGAAMCRSCREKKRIEKRSEDAMGCHRGLIR